MFTASTHPSDYHLVAAELPGLHLDFCFMLGSLPLQPLDGVGVFLVLRPHTHTGWHLADDHHPRVDLADNLPVLSGAHNQV